MDEKGKRKGDFYEEEPTTFEIHPDDVMVVPDDSDIEWLDQDLNSKKSHEWIDPFEAFDEKVLKGLEILSEMKQAILQKDQGDLSKND